MIVFFLLSFVIRIKINLKLRGKFKNSSLKSYKLNIYIYFLIKNNYIYIITFLKS